MIFTTGTRTQLYYYYYGKGSWTTCTLASSSRKVSFAPSDKALTCCTTIPHNTDIGRLYNQTLHQLLHAVVRGELQRNPLALRR